ncbi:glyoxalase/bleomycin resistance protein/dioxygenase [Rhodanobacter thiooxydans LCS2]|nr:glyoxalase/bleomycin resistance protein/dioxygenase [Rhodanobacter thiooxydans LCS2]
MRPGSQPRCATGAVFLPWCATAFFLRHLAFVVADGEAAAIALTALGVVCEPMRVDECTGRRCVFFADPDGLPIELYEA